MEVSSGSRFFLCSDNHPSLPFLSLVPYQESVGTAAARLDATPADERRAVLCASLEVVTPLRVCDGEFDETKLTSHQFTRSILRI